MGRKSCPACCGTGQVNKGSTPVKRGNWTDYKSVYGTCNRCLGAGVINVPDPPKSKKPSKKKPKREVINRKTERDQPTGSNAEPTKDSITIDENKSYFWPRLFGVVGFFIGGALGYSYSDENIILSILAAIIGGWIGAALYQWIIALILIVIAYNIFA